MAGQITVNTKVDEVDYEARIEVHPTHPEIENGYVLDIIRTSPEVPSKDVKQRIYEICHDIVLKLVRKRG